MSSKRSVPPNRDRNTNQLDGRTTPHISRTEFDAIVEELHRVMQTRCLDLADNVRRELETQFTRIAQLQQEIDAIKRRLQDAGR